MYCNKCGKQLNDGDIFCSGCGTRVELAPGMEPQLERAPEKPTQGTFQMETMRWDLEGYPSVGPEAKEPERIDWSSVVEHRGGARVSSRKFNTDSNFIGFSDGADGNSYPSFDVPEPQSNIPETIPEAFVVPEVEPVQDAQVVQETFVVPEVESVQVGQDAVQDAFSEVEPVQVAEPEVPQVEDKPNAPIELDEVVTEPVPAWETGSTTRMDKGKKESLRDVMSQNAPSDEGFDYENSVFSNSRGINPQEDEPVDDGFVPELNRGEASIFYTGSDLFDVDPIEPDMGPVVQENFEGSNTFVLERVDIADAIQEAEAAQEAEVDVPVEPTVGFDADDAYHGTQERYETQDQDYYDEYDEEGVISRAGTALRGLFGNIRERFEGLDMLVRDDEENQEPYVSPREAELEAVPETNVNAYDDTNVAAVDEVVVPREEPPAEPRRSIIRDRRTSSNTASISPASAVDDFTRDIFAAKSASDIADGVTKPRDPSDQFYTFNQKSEEFKVLIEEEYERLRQRLKEESGEDDFEAALASRRRQQAEEAIRAIYEPEPVVEVEVEPEPKVEAEPEPVIEAAPELVIQSETVVEEVAPAVEAEPEPIPEPTIEEVEPAVEAEPEPVIEEVAPVVEPELAPEPAPTQDVGPEIVAPALDTDPILGTIFEAQKEQVESEAAIELATEEIIEEEEQEGRIRYVDLFKDEEELKAEQETAARSVTDDTIVVDRAVPTAEAEADVIDAGAVTAEAEADVIDANMRAVDAEVDVVDTEVDVIDTNAGIVDDGQPVEDTTPLTYSDIFQEEEGETEISKSGRTKLLILDILIVILAICVLLTAILVFGRDTAIGQRLSSLFDRSEPVTEVVIPEEVENGESSESNGNANPVTDVSPIASAIIKEATRNTNIGEIAEDTALLFADDKDYGIEGLEYAATFTDADWYTTGGGETVTYLPELVGEIIEYNSKLVDKYNTGSDDVLALIDSDSYYYSEVAAIEPVEGVTHEITKLQIGEVRQDGDFFYVLTRVAETVSDQEDPIVTTRVVHLNTEYNEVVVENVIDVQ